jgi:S1-C subfamily serine protease
LSRPHPVLSSVVKVLTVSDAPDYEQPWQTHGASSSSGSGVIVRTKRGLRILTNGHVVQNQMFVEVRRYGSSQKYIAKVAGVGHECDLALLNVEDRAFYSRARPVKVAPLPALSDRVAVCGYPIGGDRVSVTEGIVSRIEVLSYAQSQRPLLAIQIDAAINAGNSGGPVFKGQDLVGVAFQALDEGQNIAYAIAPTVVQHFLKDLESGRFRGFPDLGVWWQRLESDSHRKSLGLSRRDGGVLVTRVVHLGSSYRQLEVGDVILKIGEVRVAGDGTVPLRQGELVDHGHLVSQRFVGDVIPLTVWRRGRRTKLNVKLRTPVQLVPEDRYDVRPTYYVFGGLLFVPLTRDYLKSWGQEWWKNAPHELVTLYDTGIRTESRQDVVILQKVLADSVNQGYHDYENVVVAAVDGVPIKGLRHLIELVAQSTSPYITFTSSHGRQFVLDRKLAAQRTERILLRFNVPADRSIDLR